MLPSQSINTKRAMCKWKLRSFAIAISTRPVKCETPQRATMKAAQLCNRHIDTARELRNSPTRNGVSLLQIHFRSDLSLRQVLLRNTLARAARIHFVTFLETQTLIASSNQKHFESETWCILKKMFRNMMYSRRNFLTSLIFHEFSLKILTTWARAAQENF